MDELHYLWIQGVLPELQRLCIKSYIKLGYKINFWTFTPKQIGIEHKNITFMDASTILENNYSHHYHYADLFRYKLLYEFGGTWIDADMFLLRKIPNTKIIISSEYCNKSGVFKKDHTNKTPNIGLLRIPKGDKMLEQSIFKCLHVVNPTDKKFMEILRNLIMINMFANLILIALSTGLTIKNYMMKKLKVKITSLFLNTRSKPIHSKIY